MEEKTMEGNQTETTYGEEVAPAERLKQLNEELKELKQQVSKERKEKLANASNVRKERDEKIKQTQVTLAKIQKLGFAYNRAGKVEKAQINVLENIVELIGQDNAVDAEPVNSTAAVTY